MGRDDRAIALCWRAIIDNCLAICDVSGSMGSIYALAHSNNASPLPTLPAVALSMTLVQLAKPPFANIFIGDTSPGM
jgi:hypothetical protein